MKKGIHPDYKPTTITCGCGEVIEMRSTSEAISVEICSKCHPFFTGKQKFVDTAGRVEKFQRRYAWTDESVKTAAVGKKKKGQPEQTPEADETPATDQPAAGQPGDDAAAKE